MDKTLKEISRVTAVFTLSVDEKDGTSCIKGKLHYPQSPSARLSLEETQASFGFHFLLSDLYDELFEKIRKGYEDYENKNS